MHVIATWLTGPDSGGRHGVAVGSTVVGTTGLHCDDPSLLPHHALLEVGHDGVWVTQLAGSAALTVGGTPVVGRSPLPVGASVGVGASTLAVGRGALPADHRPPAHQAPTRIVRAPRPIPPGIDGHVEALLAGRDPVDADTAPEAPERERPGGLLPTLVGLAGSAALAVITRRPMFIAFGAIGSAVACSSWLGQWFAFRRRHRRDLAAHAEHCALAAARGSAQRALAVAALHHVAPGVAHALRVAEMPGDGLWARRRSHRDAFTVAIGAGVDDHHLPLIVDLSGRARLAVCGPHAHAVARAVVVQLVTQCGPADLRLVVVTRSPQRWRWIAALPHLATDRGPAIVDPFHLDEAIEPTTGAPAHVVVVTDDREVLAERTSGLRRLLDGSPVPHHFSVASGHDVIPSGGPALVAVLDDRLDPPQVCTSSFTTDCDGSARWRPDAACTLAVPALVVGLGPDAAGRAATAVSRCTDPEDDWGATAAIPPAVALDMLLGRADDGRDGRRLTAQAVARRWATAPDHHDPAPCTPIGTGCAGPVEIDLVRDGPHALVAGTTGSGKSELLRTLVVGLATACSPRHLAFVLVDYKGGSAFDALTRLPHVVGTVTDLDDHLADRMLRSLHAELRRREQQLRAAGAVDLTAYRRITATAGGTVEAVPRLVVIVDEFAALAAERPSFLHALIGVAQRGRSLGVHLVLATQRPGGVVGDDIRANTTLRIALRLHEPADAIDVVGDRLPTTLPRSRPGRAVVRVGGEDPMVVQTAHCTDIDRSVDLLVDACAISPGAGGARPWLPPLPDVLDSGEVERGAVGVLDDPDRQRRLPLRHEAGDGPLVVVGSRGTGVTSTLLTLVDQRRRDRPDRPVYVIDATGDARWHALHTQRHACVITPDSGLVRLVHQLVDRPTAHHTIVVDGIDELRLTLDTPAHDHRPDHRHETRLEQLTAALLAAISAGADVVLGAALPTAVPPELVARVAHRWVLHLDDPHRAATLGIPASMVPAAIPGRVAVGALLGQVTAPRPSDTTPPRAALTDPSRAECPPWWLQPLPERIDATRLRPPVRLDRRTVVSIGLDPISGNDVQVTIDDGEHVMVLGPRGSGRTTALALLVHAIGRGRAPQPVVIDDADRVDDRDGALGRTVDTASSSVLAAARGDGLRFRTGHWTSGVRRSRLAIVLVGESGDASADGELVGVVLPRRYPVPPRPGTAWLVDGSAVTPVQLATAGGSPTWPDDRPAPSSTVTAGTPLGVSA